MAGPNETLVDLRGDRIQLVEHSAETSRFQLHRQEARAPTGKGRPLRGIEIDNQLQRFAAMSLDDRQPRAMIRQCDFAHDAAAQLRRSFQRRIGVLEPLSDELRRFDVEAESNETVVQHTLHAHLASRARYPDCLRVAREGVGEPARHGLALRDVLER